MTLGRFCSQVLLVCLLCVSAAAAASRGFAAARAPSFNDSSMRAAVRFRPARFPTWSNATHVCVVEVDANTWLPKVLRYIVSEDCGRMINPRIVDTQLSGAAVISNRTPPHMQCPL